MRNKLKSAGEAGLRADLERLPATASLATTARRRRPAESQRGARRHPRAVAAARGDGRRRRAARLRRDRTRQGRRRLSSDQRRAGSCRTGRRSSPCTPSGVIELLERSEHPDRRRPRRRDRPQRHRRQADGAAAAAPSRHGDDLPFAHASICRASPREADILVAAIGRPAFVTPDFVKPGATVVDVGTTQVTRSSAGRAAVPAGLEAA